MTDRIISLTRQAGVWKYLLLMFFCCLPCRIYATESHPVLIITSYNPETGQMAQNISRFLDEYRAQKGHASVVIESMNCKSLPEAPLWIDRMKEILTKHKNSEQPSLIVIFGQEAWAAYLSLNEDSLKDIPVICGMVSKNAVLLPDDSISILDWAPESVNVQHYIEQGYPISGFIYDYDVAANVNLILNFYPNTKHIAFISDNTYGGVSMQMLVKDEMRNFPNLDLILLDGRKSNIYSIIDQIKNLPEETAILLGTWRVDVNDGYYMGNATYSMLSANPSIPAFTISSVGLGHWALGGCVPLYRPIGGDIAAQVVKILNGSITKADLRVHSIENEYTFDQKKLDEYGFHSHVLPADSVIVNDNVNLLEKYKNEIIALSFFGLILFLITVSYHYYRMKHLKDVLQELQKDNDIILNNIQSSIKFVNPDFTVKWSNQITYPCDPEHGPEYCCLVPNSKMPYCSSCPIIKAIRTEEATTYTYQSADGRYIYTLANPIFDKKNKLQGLIVKKEDITQSKKVENELRKAKEQAEESDRLKSAFLANISHEIRTPLNAIVGFSSLLADVDIDKSERIEYINIIETNNELLLQLINDILDLAKIEANTLEFTYSNVDINKLFSETEQLFQSKVTPDVHLRFSEKQPNCVVRMEKVRLTQVITNFLTNALKFTSTGNIDFGYRVQSNDTIYFYVTDTGCGIPEQEIETVFKRFVKLNTFAQGTGLGLSICQMIVHRMGGEIGAFSEEGKGSTFWFSVPYVPLL